MISIPFSAFSWESQRYSETSLAKQLKRKASVIMLPSYIKFFEPSVIQSLRVSNRCGYGICFAEIIFNRYKNFFHSNIL